MGLFGKKNKDDAFKAQLEKEALERLNENDDLDYILPLEPNDALSGISPIGHSKVHAKSVITPEEIMGHKLSENEDTPSLETTHFVKEENIKMNAEKPKASADFLYSLMNETRENATKNVVKAEEVTPVSPKNETDDISKQIQEIIDKTESAIKPTAPEAIKTPEVSVEEKLPEEKSKSLDFESLFNELKAESAKYSKLKAERKEEKNVSEEASGFTDNLNETKEVVETPVPAKDSLSAESIEEIELVAEENDVIDKKPISLVDKCNAYLTDETSGEIRKEDAEKYKLESVESILKSLEERASKRFNFSSSQTVDLNTNDVNNLLKELKTEKNEDSFNEQELSAQADEKNAAEEKQEDNDSTMVFDAVDENSVKHYFDGSTQSEEPEIQTSPLKDIDGTQIFDSIYSDEEDNEEVIEEIFSSKNALAREDDEEEQTEDLFESEDKNKILKHLKKLSTVSLLKSFLTFVLFVSSLLFLTPIANEIKNMGLNVYHGLLLCFVILSALINTDIFRSIFDFIKGKHNTDLPFAISTVSIFAYTLIQATTSSEQFSLVPLYILSLFAASASKASRLKRIYKNSLFVYNAPSKKAITLLDNAASTNAIVGNALDSGALICYSKSTKNVEQFVKKSFCADPNSKKIVSLSLVLAAAGLVISIINLILTGSIVDALSLLTLLLLVVSAPSTLVLTDFPIASALKRLNCYGATLSGYATVSKLDASNTLATDSKELFPNGTIRLVDMKALSNVSVYQAILDAIALTENIGSPLAEMFKQAMDAPSDKPLEVDSAVYEDKMGVSGWVNDRRVFVGNRILMESHGFNNIPEIELDKKIMRKGYFPVYVATDNSPAVLFVVKYFADDEIMYELKRLCNTGTTVCVKNCDPNISAEMLCDYFGLYKDSIYVMSRHGSDQYSLITKEAESYEAGAVCTKSVCGLFATLTAAINIKRLSSVLFILYTVCSILGFLLATLVAFSGILTTISPLIFLLVQLGLSAITFLPVILKRP